MSQTAVMQFAFQGSSQDKVEVDVLRYADDEANSKDNWIIAEVRVSADSFSAVINAWLQADDIAEFLDQLRRLHKTLVGEAKLGTVDGEFRLELSGDGIGHIDVEGELFGTPYYQNRLRFAIELDQTELVDTIRQLESVVSSFPKRGPALGVPTNVDEPWKSIRSRALRRKIAVLTIGFIAGLILSGITAFPLPQEVESLIRWMGIPTGAHPTGLAGWIATVHAGLQATEARYPFLFYGTDWLAFGHLVIAVAFWGVLREPVRNAWVVKWGMIACAMVIPLALICGPIRGIPFYWQLIDCSFGVVGFVPLWMCSRAIRELEALGVEA